MKSESQCIWPGTGRHTLPWEDTCGRLPIPTQKAGVGLEMELQLAPASGWLWVLGGAHFVPDLYHSSLDTHYGGDYSAIAERNLAASQEEPLFPS